MFSNIWSLDSVKYEDKEVLKKAKRLIKKFSQTPLNKTKLELLLELLEWHKEYVIEKNALEIDENLKYLYSTLDVHYGKKKDEKKKSKSWWSLWVLIIFIIV